MDPLAENGNFECATCSKSFPNFGLVEKHGVEVHGREETMKCHFGCETLFKRRMTVIFHVRSQRHRGSGPSNRGGWIGCDICDAFTITNGFPDEERLSDHVTRIHGKVVKHLLVTLFCLYPARLQNVARIWKNGQNGRHGAGRPFLPFRAILWSRAGYIIKDL